MWETARHGIVVSFRISRSCGPQRRSRTPTRIFDAPNKPHRGHVQKALRPHHWVKNLLVLVPLVLAHKLFDIAYVIPALIGLMAFCLSASAVYLVNDMLDMPADRKHPGRGIVPGLGECSVPVALVMTFLLCWPQLHSAWPCT